MGDGGDGETERKKDVVDGETGRGACGRAMMLGDRWRGGRVSVEGVQVGRGARLRAVEHYVFHRRIWNPINQAEERKDAERMRSPFTLMRPGRGKRSTT